MRSRHLVFVGWLSASLVAAPALPPGNAIRVKGVSGDTVLQLLPTEAGGLVRADMMARLLGGTLDSVDGGRWRLALYGTTLELIVGAPFAAYNGFTLPLVEATRIVDGVPHVTLQLFSEIIPRFGIGILWDRSRSEVRLFEAIARRAIPLAPPGTTPAPVVSALAAAVTDAASTSADRMDDATADPTGDPTPGLSRRYTIVVDAGHGGRDPGMRGAMVGGRPVSEARVTLAVAGRLQRMLKEKGIRVVMTRTRDTLIALGDRGPIANHAKGDIFISVHVNSANPKWKNPTTARGFETFYLSTARTEDEAHVAAMENDVVRFETEADAPKGDPLAFIINDLARNEHLRESSELASVVQQKLALTHPGPDRGVKQGGLRVLVTAYMPSVLVEIGFGSNPAEARWMMSEAGQDEAARAIADAAFEYLKHYDRRTRTSQR